MGPLSLNTAKMVLTLYIVQLCLFPGATFYVQGGLYAYTLQQTKEVIVIE